MKVRFLLSSVLLSSGFALLPIAEPSSEASVPVPFTNQEQAVPAQPAVAPEPELIAARVGNARIEMRAYREHLLRISGRRPLDTLIDRLLVQQEAQRLELSVTETAIDAAVESAWTNLLRRYNGDESRFLEDLQMGGYLAHEYRANLRDEAHHEWLARAVCAATRVITDEDLREQFSIVYGSDGDFVEVQHIFLSAARLRADLIRQGVAPNELGPAELEARCRKKLAEVLERLEAGEEFGLLAGRFSHDFAAKQTGGRFAEYNYRAYGEEFASAVRAASVGIPVGPIQTEAGFHVIEVTSRVHTEFEAVAESLRQELGSAPATLTEIQSMVARLRNGVEIETY